MKVRNKVGRSLAGLAMSATVIGGLPSCATSDGNSILSAVLGASVGYQDTAGGANLAQAGSIATRDIARNQSARESRTQVNVNVNTNGNQTYTQNQQNFQNVSGYNAYSFIDKNNDGDINGGERVQYEFKAGEIIMLKMDNKPAPRRGSKVSTHVINSETGEHLPGSLTISEGNIWFSLGYQTTESMAGKMFLVEWRVNDQKVCQHYIKIE